MARMDARTRAAFAATALLLYSGSLYAQEVAAVPPGADQIIPVKKGTVVPFDGQLFDNNTSLRWANWLVQYKNLVTTNKELDQKVCSADTTLADTKYALLQKQYDTVTQDLQTKLTAAQTELASPPWYRTVGFGVALGVVGSLALVGITAYAVQK
jgi:hypothetical protein